MDMGMEHGLTAWKWSKDTQHWHEHAAQLYSIDVKHAHIALTYVRDMQHGEEALTRNLTQSELACTLDIQQGHAKTCSILRYAVWTYSMNMSHGNAAVTWSIEMRHGHATWTCRVDMKQRHIAHTCRNDMQHMHIAWTCRDMLHGYEAWNFSMHLQDGHSVGT